MTKPTEAQLYDVFLYLYYADASNESIVEEAAEQLKEARKRSRKIKKLLQQVSARYVDLYGKKPMESRRY